MKANIYPRPYFCGLSIKIYHQLTVITMHLTSVIFYSDRIGKVNRV